ncbi:hypothetical protein [Sulfolobus acidocaldarius]|uniref:Conserved Archaeal membrane protein n=4 Tax=Sulfolobus acidocaldarius TaxID=2285 RepID=Q4JA19_SULAC|nr:hypothetical protein [Sulfolobus acidocaldarius]AAY80361.1 conserved Archaeal membrane protein [Sulfolobus acidocaldarius DSM 639]AGE70944.1 hypothetical protein SacN8_04865 [Sulfolobus acidocaldarius N8]AGE73215.1 hypothetical protein SacRon12I_04855 [Sulfolobus acidocaldarius Ron12/I]ALU28751.1 hypothetical protein ATY89_01440 [Sulfolobus acidocaldarius]ALU31471.1 hypothetical protein ATZ20_04475 [Sulfolobus acidocaldarius]
MSKQTRKRKMEAYKIAITSIIGYVIPAYLIVSSAYVVDQFSLPTWLSYVLVSIPFLGRLIGALIYQRIIRIVKSDMIFSLSLTILGIVSLLLSVTNVNYILIMWLRFTLGIIFGIIASLSIDQAVRSGNRIVIGLALSGWAIGWIFAQASYSLLDNWRSIYAVGVISLPLALLGKYTLKFKAEDHIILDNHISLYTIMIFLLTLEPSFILTLAPQILERQGELELLLLAYVLSLPMYIVNSVINYKVAFTLSGISAGIFGFLFFLTGSPILIIPLVMFGITITSVVPKVFNSKNTGASINIASIEGAVVPVVGTVSDYVAGGMTLFSMITLVAMYFGEKKILGNKSRAAV